MKRVSADVVNEPAAYAAHATFGIRGDFDRPVLIALLRRIGEMLAAILDPFDRTAQQGRGGDRGDVFGIDAQLWAKTAADVRRGDAQPAFVEIDIIGQRVLQIVGLLRGGPDLGFAVGDLHQDAAAFHGMRGAAMDPKVLMHDVGGLGECRVAIAVNDFVGDDPVRRQFAAHGWRRLDPAIDRRRQHVVIDRDKGCGILGDIAVARDDDGDRLADERHFAVGQGKRPALVELCARIRSAHHAPLPQHRSEIVERQHGDDAGHRACRVGIDAADQRVRMRAAHEGRVQRAGRGNVVDEPRAAVEQRKIFEPRDARSDLLAHWPSLEIALVARAMTSFGV